MSLQVVTSPGGGLPWGFGALRGPVHDNGAEWVWEVTAPRWRRPTLLRSPAKATGQRPGEDPVQGQRQAGIPERDQPHPRQAPSPGEQANAQRKMWRILCKLRCCPRYAGKPAKAIHVLQVRDQDEKIH